MAATKKNAKKKKEEKKPLYSDYPIKALFQFSVLVASISFVLYYVSNPNDIVGIFFKSFLIFSAVAIAGGIVLVAVFTVLGNMREKEHQQYIEELKQEAERIQEERRQRLLEIQNAQANAAGNNEKELSEN
ncbi:MAG: hypothetical protein J0M05_12280 [Candidatus Kapabacteria bacterium]|jgi:uncharacterized membrane protein|nr:hypothetical protein [Candidatus Kapabacteria bacterium]